MRHSRALVHVVRLHGRCRCQPARHAHSTLELKHVIGEAPAVAVVAASDLHRGPRPRQTSRARRSPLPPPPPLALAATATPATAARSHVERVERVELVDRGLDAREHGARALGHAWARFN